MISAIHWIRQGVAAQHPEKYDLNDKEYDRINKLAADQLEDAREHLKEAEEMAVDQQQPTTTPATKDDDDMARYNLDSYDDDVEADKNKRK